MTDRTNEEWLTQLRPGHPKRAEALEDLRARLERGTFFYLRTDRSDLLNRTDEEIRHMAEDFVQDAMLKILDNLDTFRGESKFMTWASKIAMRVAISELRRVRWKNYSLDYLTASGEIMPSITDLGVTPEDGPPPENLAERQDVLRVIGRAFRSALTERQRAALTAYVIDGVTTEEIARRMDTNRNALYKLIHDARKKLKEYMEQQGLSLEYILKLWEE
jgi:RNA polymerase sigma-70 factor (ECF subfamily)